jgi:hypothetical protein
LLPSLLSLAGTWPQPVLVATLVMLQQLLCQLVLVVLLLLLVSHMNHQECSGPYHNVLGISCPQMLHLQRGVAPCPGVRKH